MWHLAEKVFTDYTANIIYQCFSIVSILETFYFRRLKAFCNDSAEEVYRKNFFTPVNCQGLEHVCSGEKWSQTWVCLEKIFPSSSILCRNIPVIWSICNYSVKIHKNNTCMSSTHMTHVWMPKCLFCLLAKDNQNFAEFWMLMQKNCIYEGYYWSNSVLICKFFSSFSIVIM